MTMAVGEIGMGPMDEFQGPKYIGKGYGSRHAVAHGIMGDYALVAESTDFGVTGVEAGAAYFKVTLHGTGYYTPRLPLRGAFKDTLPNVVIFNTDLVNPKDAPKSYNELLDPKWKGKNWPSPM